VAIHRHPKAGFAFEFHPFVAAGQPVLQAAMMYAPFADQKVEVMRMVCHGGFSV
jgi:hypothetical protein